MVLRIVITVLVIFEIDYWTLRVHEVYTNNFMVQYQNWIVTVGYNKLLFITV